MRISIITFGFLVLIVFLEACSGTDRYPEVKAALRQTVLYLNKTQSEADLVRTPEQVQSFLASVSNSALVIQGLLKPAFFRLSQTEGDLVRKIFESLDPANTVTGLPDELVGSVSEWKTAYLKLNETLTRLNTDTVGTRSF